MENEENRGLINKKDFADQLVSFFQCIFGALSLFSLSLSHTLGYLEFSCSTLGECGYLVIWSKKEKEEHESARGIWDQHLQQVLSVGIEFHV